MKAECTKAKGNRHIQVSSKLIEYHKQASENLTTEQGKQLRAERCEDEEMLFGHIKYNMGFRRFHLMGLEKVKTEWGLVCVAHNMRKLAG